MKNFLLIEDNVDDIELFKRALYSYKDKIVLNIAENYEIAAPLIKSKRFDLIILDINLPRKNGLEILKEIRASKLNGRAPACIFTSSALNNDIETAYKYGCNAYIEKPFNYKDFIERAKSVFSFWLFNLTN